LTQLWVVRHGITVADGQVKLGDMPVHYRRSFWTKSRPLQYTVMNSEGKPEEQRLWYVPEEPWFSLRHDQDANLKQQLFMHLETATAYTLIWPVKDILPGDELTLDYLADHADPEQRKIFSFAYMPELALLDERVCEQFVEEFKSMSLTSMKQATSKKGSDEVPIEAELGRGNIHPEKRTFRVFTDIEYVATSLKVASQTLKERFELVNSPAEADILWLAKMISAVDHHGKFANVWLNQFPGDNCLTVKDLMLETVYDYYGRSMTNDRLLENQPPWFSRSYNLNTDTKAFIGEYIERQRMGLPNTWITKPWNGTRSQGCTVSRHLPELLKQLATGPKIVSKYIDKPALLFGGRKFDLRVVVLLESVQPLRMWVNPSTVYPRVANKPYICDEAEMDYDDFERHFTVMKYRDLPVDAVSQAELVQEYTQKYGHRRSWKEFEHDMFQAIRGLFEAASTVPPDSASKRPVLKHRAQSRSIYGIDVMIDEVTLSPMILEVSMVPDTGRICSMQPDFYMDVFRLMFGGEKVDGFTAI
jgi:hypothetical protein